MQRRGLTDQMFHIIRLSIDAPWIGAKLFALGDFGQVVAVRSPPLPSPVRRCQRNASHRTPCAIPTPCSCAPNNVDIATIALWLGHETTQTTHLYEHADPALKERAIARTAPLGAKPGRYHATDELLASSKRCDYVERLICQTLRCKGNRSRQVSIQHNRPWDIDPFMWNST